MGISKVETIFDQMMLCPTVPLLEDIWTIIHSLLKVRGHNTRNYTYLTYLDIFDSCMYVCICTYMWIYAYEVMLSPCKNE